MQIDIASQRLQSAAGIVDVDAAIGRLRLRLVQRVRARPGADEKRALLDDTEVDLGGGETAALASFEVLRSAVALHVGGDPGDLNCTTDAWAAWAAMHGAASLLVAGTGSNPDKRLSRATLIDRTVAMVLDGLDHSHG